MGKGKVVPVLN